jgi:ABC-type transporter Mla subunit MlaD
MNVDFFATLGSLLFHYVTDAFVFFVGHVLLALMVWRTLREIDTEARSLDDWDASQPGNQGSCAALLSQFVDESRVCGKKGVFVPISEFSDRIDARVLSLEESVQNRANFFVVIGIAGTFFALFRFAQNAAPNAADALDARVITDLLRASLANAFPVGFAGLVLSIVAYFISQVHVERLRDAVGRATRTALAIRGQGIWGVSQGLQEALREELAPLRNFDATLGEKLQPVMHQFREQLAESSDLLATKVAPLGEAAASLKASTATLSNSLDGLATAADRLPAAFEAVEVLHQQTANATTALQKSFSGTARDLKTAAEFVQSAGAQLESTSRAIRKAATAEISDLGEDAGKVLERLAEDVQAMAGTPEMLVNEYRAQFSVLVARLGEEWSSSVGKLITGLESHHIEALHSLQQEALKSAAAMETTARHMRESAESVDLLLNRGIRIVADSAVERLHPHLTRIDAALSEHVPALERGLGNAAAAVAILGVETQRVLDHFKAAAESLERARAGLESTTSNLAPTSLQPLLASLEKIAAKLDRPPGLPDRIGGWFRRSKEHRVQ